MGSNNVMTLSATVITQILASTTVPKNANVAYQSHSADSSSERVPCRDTGTTPPLRNADTRIPPSQFDILSVVFVVSALYYMGEILC